MRSVIYLLILYILTTSSSQSYGYADYKALYSYVDSLQELAYHNRRHDPKLSLKLAFQSLQLSESEEYDQGVSIAYERIGAAYRYLGMYDSSKIYLRRGITYDNANDLFENELTKLNNYGLVCRRLDPLLDSAEYYFTQCIEKGKGINSFVTVSKAQNNLANHYRVYGLYEKSLELNFANLDLRVKLGDSSGIASTLNNLGNYFANEKKYASAIDYYSRNIAINIALKDSFRLAQAYLNIGSVLYDSAAYDSIYTSDVTIINSKHTLLASTLAVYNRELLDSAEICFGSSKSYMINFNSINAKRIKTNATMGEANVMILLGNYPYAVRLYKECIEAYRLTGDDIGVAMALNNLGNTFRLAKKLDSALFYFDKALPLSSLDERLQYQISWNIAKALRNKGSETLAFNFLQDYDIKKSKVRDLERDKIINNLNTKYETEKKEQQIGLQEAELQVQQANLNAEVAQKNGLMVTLIVTACLVLVIVYFYQHRQKTLVSLRDKDRTLYNKQVDDLLKEGEINSLNALMEGQETERKRIAEDLHDRLGSMLAAVKLNYAALKPSLEQTQQLEKASGILDETIDETRKIAHNLASGVLSKFGLVAALNDLKDKITGTQHIQMEVFAHNMDRRFTTELEVNLYRCVQELVSNVLKHADASKITVQLTVPSMDMLTIMVEDDGQGFDPAYVANGGMGLSNLEARISKLDGTLSIDSVPGRGTTTIIEIPIYA